MLLLSERSCCAVFTARLLLPGDCTANVVVVLSDKADVESCDVAIMRMRDGCADVDNSVVLLPAPPEDAIAFDFDAVPPADKRS